MATIRLLFFALVTAVFISGGLRLFVEWEKLEEKIELQQVVIDGLAKLAAEPYVEASLDKPTGDVAVRVNGNTARLHAFPGLCPRVLEF